MDRIYNGIWVDENFAEQSVKEQLDHLLELMQAINRIESKKQWRIRFASEEQFRCEYPDGYEKELAAAWILIKRAYLSNKIEIDEFKSTNKEKYDNVYIEILEKFADEDLDRILLEDSDEEV